MGPNAVEHLCSEILWLDESEGPHPMFRVEPGPSDHRAQRILPGVPERRMADVVAEADRFGEILVETEGAGHGPAHLVHLDGVGHTGHEVVPIWIEEYLGLVLEPAEGLGVDDAVPIALECGPELVGLLVFDPAFRV